MINQPFPFKHGRLLYEQALQKKNIYFLLWLYNSASWLYSSGPSWIRLYRAGDGNQFGSGRKYRAAEGGRVVQGGAYDRIQWWLSVRIYYQGEYEREQPLARLT